MTMHDQTAEPRHVETIPIERITVLNPRCAASATSTRWSRASGGWG